MNLLPVFITVFSVLLLYHIFRSKPTAITFERLEQLSGTDVANFSNLKILGANNTVQFLNGSWELLQDLDNNWIYYERFYYQPPTEIIGSEKFHPISVPNRSFRVCDFLNSDRYRIWWAYNRYAVYYPEPQTERWLCPFPKGEYRVLSMALGNKAPPWLTKVGAYKMEFGLVSNGAVRMMGMVYLRLETVVTSLAY